MKSSIFKKTTDKETNVTIHLSANVEHFLSDGYNDSSGKGQTNNDFVCKSTDAIRSSFELFTKLLDIQWSIYPYKKITYDLQMKGTINAEKCHYKSNNLDEFRDFLKNKDIINVKQNELRP